MSKVLKSSYPQAEVVHCMCGTQFEVETGDGWKVIDTHTQIQEDGSRVDLPTRIEFHVPCPNCEFEKTFILVVDDMSGDAWEHTRKARADLAALKASTGVPPHSGPDVSITNSAVPPADGPGVSKVEDWRETLLGNLAPGVDPNPVVPFAPTGAIPGRDSQPEDTTLPANQAQPQDNPNPAVLAAIYEQEPIGIDGDAAGEDASEGETSTITTGDDVVWHAEGGESVEDELQAAATGDPDTSAEDVASEKPATDKKPAKKAKS